jgi:hypothetical protein
MTPLAARLTLARATAWALLLAGWVGLGGVALSLTPDLLAVHALVALWLLALGVAATVATRDSLRAGTRRAALAACALPTAAALLWAGHGGGLAALLLALAGWAALTALASGVVRSLRLVQAARPRPPVGAASLGALVAALLVADPGDAAALAQRLAALLLGAAALLALLQLADRPGAAASACRAGLFDCSLPAWPGGAWRDPQQWPLLLAGLAMLPMMAALPLMVAWCRQQAWPPQALVLLHFGAMFGPALLLRGALTNWPLPRLAGACAALLALGAALVLAAPAPWDLLGVALAQGAAWSLAWSGQLWAPARRGQQGSSPLRAALGYALLTLIVGVVVDRLGPRGLSLTHAMLGGLALLAWGIGLVIRPRKPATLRRT